MSSESWIECKFSDLCDITRGASPRPIHDFISSTGMPWIKIADATSSDSRFITKTKECIKLEGVKSSVEVGPGDLILSNSATPGLPKFVQIKACIHDGWMLLRNFRGLDKRFAYWLLLNERKNLVSQGTGTVFTNLKTDILKNHKVKIPNLDIQKAIAKQLDDIAEKIELNSKVNQTLEQIAQAIFKSWFVDFVPVKAKIQAKQNGQDPERAAMRTISGKTDEELDQLSIEQRQQIVETAALFPDEIENSEIGEIPKGWQWSTIGDEVEVVGGSTPSTKNPDFWEGGEINWTSPKDLSGLQDKVLLKTEKKITEAGIEKISSGLLPINTVLMSSRAPVGYLALAKIPVAVNQGYIAMKCNKRLPPEYVLQWSEAWMDEIKSRASGSTFAEISKKNFKPIKVVVPKDNILNEYSNQTKSIFDMITESVVEIESLSNIRDSLLPKLLSGMITINSPNKDMEVA